MTTLHEAPETLKERARRALLANSMPPERAQLPPDLEVPVNGEEIVEQVDLRLRAIRLVRDLEPKRARCADRVRELSRSLGVTPGDSIHYRSLLDRLGESHEDWLELEERLWSAHYVIRSTQWVVDLLTCPTRHEAD
jgi:hypothetical protein